MTETNPTAAEFARLVAELKVAERACSDARGSNKEEAAGQRVIAASAAILSARPTDPSVMAAQLRFLVADSVSEIYQQGRHRVPPIAMPRGYAIDPNNVRADARPLVHRRARA
jgi:hypothetical protein